MLPWWRKNLDFMWKYWRNEKKNRFQCFFGLNEIESQLKVKFMISNQNRNGKFWNNVYIFGIKFILQMKCKHRKREKKEKKRKLKLHTARYITNVFVSVYTNSEMQTHRILYFYYNIPFHCISFNIEYSIWIWAYIKPYETRKTENQRNILFAFCFSEIQSDRICRKPRPRPSNNMPSQTVCTASCFMHT